MEVPYVCYLGKRACGCDCSRCGLCANYGPDRRRADRRDRHLTFRLVERRSGFDPRQAAVSGHTLLGRAWRRLLREIRHDSLGLLVILLLINLLNLLDYYLTLGLLAAGHQELNPLMRALYAQSAWVAGGFKMGVGVAITSGVWLARRYRRVLAAAVLVFMAYILLIVYHVVGGIRWG